MNLWHLPDLLPNSEITEALIPDRGVLIERIVSTGQTTPAGIWYDQERDEWVVLLQGQARLVWENGKVMNMAAGDWVFIPAHERHRVDYTSHKPPCIWLAVQGRLV
ncbi:MAG: cupin domain-containing protein [Firmicutes bacterium]|nr:cupin domain-containing protein [Bacillota bacterium]